MSDVWKEIKDAVGEYAPMVAAGIGLVNPAAGAVASTAAGLLSKVFGVPADQPDALSEAVKNASPEQKLALIAEGNRNKEALLAEANRHEEAEVTVRLAEVQSARTREVENTKATGKRDTNLYVLAWVVVGGYFLLCVTLLNVDIPVASKDIIMMLFGGLSAGFMMVLGYFFGSSQSSAVKTQMLNDQDN
jgi:hypothetical protein